MRAAVVPAIGYEARIASASTRKTLKYNAGISNAPGIGIDLLVQVIVAAIGGRDVQAMRPSQPGLVNTVGARRGRIRCRGYGKASTRRDNGMKESIMHQNTINLV